MVNYTARELKIVIPQWNRARRKNRILLLVEGNFDKAFFSSFLKSSRDVFDVLGLDHEKGRSNKEDVISFVNKSEHSAIGFVDSDFDYAVDLMQDDIEKVRPYGAMILDTEKCTDLNMLIISKMNLEDYLQKNIPDKSKIVQIVQVSRIIGVIRFFKRHYERKNPGKILHLKFPSIHESLTERPNKCSINDIRSILEVKSSKNSNNDFFFNKITEKKIITTLDRFTDNKLDIYSFVNGHDITKLMKSIGGINNINIETELRKIGEKNENLCKELYSRLISLS